MALVMIALTLLCLGVVGGIVIGGYALVRTYCGFGWANLYALTLLLSVMYGVAYAHEEPDPK